MSFPVVVGTPTESNATADDTTPFTVSRPAGVNQQLTIVVIGTDGQPTLTWPSGYTEFANISRAGNFTLFAAYHLEDGTESTTFDITSSASEKWAAIVYSISSAADPTTRAPEATTVETGTGTLNPDPPSITPTGGTKEYLFIASVLQTGEEADDDTWATAAPTNYTSLLQKTTDVAGLAGTNASLATAQRANTVSTEDPGTFTCAQSLIYAAATIAVHPLASPTFPAHPSFPHGPQRQPHIGPRVLLRQGFPEFTTAAVSVSAPFIGPTATLFAPTKVTLTVQPGLIGPTSTLFAPTKVTLTVKPGLIGPTNTLFAPTKVTLTVKPGVIGPTGTLFAPTKIVYTVRPGFIGPTGTLFAPTKIAYTVKPGFVGPTGTLFAPTVIVVVTKAPPLIGPTSTLFAPTRVYTSRVYAPFIISGPTLYAITVDVAARHVESFARSIPGQYRPNQGRARWRTRS